MKKYRLCILLAVCVLTMLTGYASAETGIVPLTRDYSFTVDQGGSFALIPVPQQ